MKQRFKRLCSLLLTAALVVTSVPGMETTAYASQSNEATVSETEQSKNGETTEKITEETTQTEHVQSENTVWETESEEITPEKGLDEETVAEETVVESEAVTEETVVEETVAGNEETVAYNEQIVIEETTVCSETETMSETESASEEETVDIINEDSNKEGEDIPSWIFNFEVKGTAEEQEDVLSKVKVQSIDGTQDLGMSVPIESYDDFAFHIEVPQGYTLISISGAKGYKLKMKKDFENNNFTVLYAHNYYDEPNIQLKAVIDKVQNKELYIEYPDTIEAVEVLCDGTPVELINGKASVLNTAKIVLNVKAKEGQMVTATYESENDTYPMIYDVTSVSDDNIYTYEIGHVVYNTNVVFSTTPGANINFDVDEGVSGYFYGSEDDYNLSNNLSVRRKIGTNINIYFDLDSSKLAANKFELKNVFSDGTEEILDYNHDYVEGGYLCKYVVTKDATISFKWVPKTTYKITFDSELLEIYKANYDGEEYYIDDKENCLNDEETSVYAGETIYFAVRMDNAYKFEYVSPTGEAEDALERVYSYDDGCDIYYIYKYQLHEDTEMYIEAIAKEVYTIDMSLENIIAYDVWCENSDYGIEEIWEQPKEILEGYTVIFAVRCEADYKIEYVSPTGEAEDALKKISTYDDDCGGIYDIYKYTPTADTTIYAKAVKKMEYVLSFNFEENVSVRLRGLEDMVEPGDYDVYEGNHIIYVDVNDDSTKIVSITASGTDTQNNIKLEKKYDDEDSRYYYVVPVTENITFSITASTKQEYDLQLVSDENVTITDVTGTVANEENIYTVRENDLISFKVTPNDGYDIEAVTIKNGENNSQVLYPVIIGNVYSYAAKINSDTQINIVASEKEAYKVSFKTENATIECENNTDENGKYIAYADEKFIFTVISDEGYIIDEVTGADDLQLLYNSHASRSYYQFIPKEDTDITVTTKAAEDSEISFEYEGDYKIDDTLIWYESGDLLDLTGGKVTVSSDKAVWFDLSDDADKNVSVKCTTSSGEEKPIYRTVYNGKEGFFIGNVTEDVQITIRSYSLYTINLNTSKYENEKFIPIDGMGELLQTQYVPYGEKFCFRVVTEDGYKLRNVSVRGVIGNAKISGSLDTGIYCIEPRRSDYLELYVNVSSLKLSNGELKFNYPSEDVSLKAYVGDEEVILVDNSIILPSTETLTFKVKPLTDKLVSLSIDLEPESIEEDGTQVYVIDDVLSHSLDPIIIYAKEYYTVNLQNENANILIRQYDSEVGEWLESVAEMPIKVAKGDKLNFRIKGKEGYLINRVSLADEKTGTIEKKYAYDEYDEYIEYEYYELTPSANVTINVDVKAIEYNTYNFVYNSEEVDLYIGSVYEYDEYGCYIQWTECEGEYKRERLNTQKVIFKLRTRAGYKVSSVKTDRENPDVTKGYDEYDTEDFYYYLLNTEDTTVTINTEEINYYDFTFKQGIGVESITVFEPNNWDEYYVGVNGLTLSNEFGYYIIPSLYDSTGDGQYEYKIVSVKANGKELKGRNLEDYYGFGYGYWLSSDFSENVEIVIETARNEALVNTTEIEVNGEENTCKLFHYVESENEDGEMVTSKVYIDLDSKLYSYGKTKKIGIEPAEEYIISKVELTRNGKIQALTVDEEGFYSIYYPLSRGLKGTLTVYTELKNKPVEIYTALPLSLVNEDGTLTEAVPEDGVYSSDSGLKYVASVEGSINGKAVITKAEITAENAQAVSSVSISEDKKQAVISIAKEDEGKLLYVNLYAGEKSELVATYIIIVNKPNLIESVTIDGITDGKASQETDTIKAYKLNIKTNETELPKIGVEVIPAEGYSDKVVKAELKDGNLELTVSAISAAENVATVRLYEETEYNKLYIPGGTFTVSILSPSKLVNTDVQAEVSKKYDVMLNLNVHVPGGLNELVTG